MRALIVPAAGQGSRFAHAGYTDPKPLIPLSTGQIMLAAAIKPFLNHVDEVSSILSNGLTEDQMGTVTDNMRKIMDEAPDARCQRIGGQLIYPQLGGAALSVLCMQGRIHDACEVIVINSDQIFDQAAIDDWLANIDANRPSGSILTFPVTDPSDTKWSFVEKAGDYVLRVAEKNKISDEATCGAYYFASWGLLRAAICHMISANDRTNNEFYLAPAYNYLGHADVRTFQVDPSQFTGLGTPELLREWEAANAVVPKG